MRIEGGRNAEDMFAADDALGWEGSGCVRRGKRWTGRGSWARTAVMHVVLITTGCCEEGRVKRLFLRGFTEI